ncbi:MAG: hypothetical protein Q9186_000501 [Xanthomendoza sp. 1 TL-2023]
MSYYSISAILTSAQKVPCTFDLPIPNLGFLDDNPGGDIPPNIPLPLPLYLAELLAVQTIPTGPSSSSNSTARPLLNLDLPTSLQPRVLNALRADAKSVDMRGLEVYFYEGASRVLELLEEEEVGEGVAEKRAAEIADHARNARGGVEGGEFLRGLDEWERGCEFFYSVPFSGVEGEDSA